MRVVLTVIFICLLPAITAAEKISSLDSQQKLGYALGMDIGNSIRTMDPPINLNYLLQGIKDVYLEQEMLLTPDESFQERRKFALSYNKSTPAKEKATAQKERVRKNNNLLQWRKEKAAENAQKEKGFFKKNKNKQGVISTDSGLQYLIIEEGGGNVPRLTDIVSVHYIASVLAGKEFDNSYKRNEPVLFPVKDAILGWQEILQLMKVGAKYRVFIPAKLAYGKYGSGTLVDPGATLMFEIELLGIEDKKSYQKKTKDWVYRVPPYTDPSLPRRVERKEIEHKPFVSKADVSLQTTEGAVISFIKMINSLLPVSSFEDAADVCKIIATDDYFDNCRKKMEGRIVWLKSQVGINGAEFTYGKVVKDVAQADVFLGSWQEVLSFSDGTSRTVTPKILVRVREINGEWKISEIIKK